MKSDDDARVCGRWRLGYCGSLACGGGTEHRPGPDRRRAVGHPEDRLRKIHAAERLEVILSEDHRLPLVAVNLWYHVGPANEEPGRTGFAHLFEHMMFQGSKHVPGDTHFRSLEGAGGSSINGTTDFDRTNYFETLPAEPARARRCGSSPIAWAICSTRSTRPTCRTSRTSSATSGGRASRTSPTASSKRRCSISSSRRTHPYYAIVIGSHADIQAAKLEDVKNFFKLYYAPNNASLAIVGDIDKAATKKLVEKYFGTLKQGQPGAEAVGRDAADHRRAARRREGSRRAAARLHGVAHARRSSSRATPTPTSRHRCSAAAGRAACTRSSSTRSRSRRTCRRSSTR